MNIWDEIKKDGIFQLNIREDADIRSWFTIIFYGLIFTAMAFDLFIISMVILSIGMIVDTIVRLIKK